MEKLKINQKYQLNQNSWIFGSIHISSKSQSMIKEIMEEIHPDWILLELDEQRLENIRSMEQSTASSSIPPSTHSSLPSSRPPSPYLASSHPPPPHLASSHPSPSLKTKSVTNPDSTKLIPSISTKPTSHGDTDSSESISSISNAPNFLQILSNFQEKMGDVLGINPGAEMITAINYAETHKIPIKLIDRPISETLERLMENMENFIDEHDEIRDELEESEISEEFDSLTQILSEFENPVLLQELLKEFHDRFPEIAKILLDERDEYMFREIKAHFKAYPDGSRLIIVGGGHLETLTRKIQQFLQSPANISKI